MEIMDGLSSSSGENTIIPNPDILFRVEDLKKENQSLNRVVTDIAYLVSYTNVEAQIKYLISRCKDYFVPKTMCFFVQPPRGMALRQYFYSELSESNKTLPEECFAIFRQYFEDLKLTANNGFAFPFENMVDDLPKNLPEELIAAEPKYVIPLFGIGGVFSIIIMSGKNDGEPYSYSDQTYFHRIFSVLAVTMQNGLHYEVSITEPKTGLFTYEYFKAKVEENLATCRRYNRTSAMLIMDIDFFKKFNDTYGHLVGDKVLVALADTLKRTVRENDCVARFGGEEFSILLTECTRDGVWEVAERIRKAVEKIELWEGDTLLHITISIGACFMHGQKGLTPTYVFKKADDALYYSKQNGRNRSTIYSIGLKEAADLAVGNIEVEE